MDHFGDAPVRDPYETYNRNPEHEDTSTITTRYTSGVPASEPNQRNLNGQTEAETLAAQYKSLRPPSTINPDNTSANRLTYIDEDYNYYPSKPLPMIDDKLDASLVENAADVGRSGDYQDLEYADPKDDTPNVVAEKAPLARFMDNGRYPLEQRIEDKRRGIGRQRYPFLSMFFWSSRNE
jgi:hypothetical protein